MCSVKYLWYPHKKKKKKKSMVSMRKESNCLMLCLGFQCGNWNEHVGHPRRHCHTWKKYSIFLWDWLSHVKCFILCLPLAWWIGKVYYNDFDLQVIFDRDRSSKNIYVKLFMKVTCFGLFLHEKPCFGLLSWIIIDGY